MTRSVLDSVKAAGTRETADFQVTPSGDIRGLHHDRRLSGYENAGHAEVYRYDAVG